MASRRRNRKRTIPVERVSAENKKKLRLRFEMLSKKRDSELSILVHIAKK